MDQKYLDEENEYLKGTDRGMLKELFKSKEDGIELRKQIEAFKMGIDTALKNAEKLGDIK
ncbi:hypothetical protein J5893_00820 [bacterium]|nr:hypothetical protein [bacterium]